MVTTLVIAVGYLLGVLLMRSWLKKEYQLDLLEAQTPPWIGPPEPVVHDDSKFAWVWPLLLIVVVMLYLFETLPQRLQKFLKGK